MLQKPHVDVLGKGNQLVKRRANYNAMGMCVVLEPAFGHAAWVGLGWSLDSRTPDERLEPLMLGKWRLEWNGWEGVLRVPYLITQSTPVVVIPKHSI